MERAAKPLTTRDTLLLITRAAGGEIPGKTVMQKLAYFCALELGAGFSHRPHYFGPYSSRVDDALENAVIAGELTEDVEVLPGWRGSDDVHRYRFSLSASGADRTEELMAEHDQEWSRIHQAVHAIKEVLPSLDQITLSSAAKTYLIVSESPEGVAESEIPGLASRLGWELDPSQVRRTVEVLDRLGLLEGEEAPAES